MTGADFSGVDIDLLADYIGGALEGTPDESAVATLIAEDPAWREAYDRLGGGIAVVRAELGRLGPEPMPADLAAKLDGMFAPVPRLTVVPGGAADDVREKASDRVREKASDGVREIGSDRVRGNASDGVRGKLSRRRRRWATPIAIAAGFIAFAGFGADYLAGRGGDETTGAGSAADSAELTDSGGSRSVTASGTDYTRATLALPPVTPMNAPKSEAFSGQSGVEDDQRRMTTLSTDPALTRLTAPEALDECLAAIQQENAGGPLDVQTIDYARFDGVPALIVRFTASNGAQAWAAGADCGTPPGDADTIDKVPVR